MLYIKSHSIVDNSHQITVDLHFELGIVHPFKKKSLQFIYIQMNTKSYCKKDLYANDFDVKKDYL